MSPHFSANPKTLNSTLILEHFIINPFLMLKWWKLNLTGIVNCIVHLWFDTKMGHFKTIFILIPSHSLKLMELIINLTDMLNARISCRKPKKCGINANIGCFENYICHPLQLTSALKLAIPNKRWIQRQSQAIALFWCYPLHPYDVSGWNLYHIESDNINIGNPYKPYNWY